jgi:hypothetical protein
MATQTRAARLLTAAIADYVTGMPVDSISDPFPMEKILRAEGRIKTGKKGPELSRKVQVARGTTSGMSVEATSTFTPVNRVADMRWVNKGFKTTDRVHEIDLIEASGESELYDILENCTMWMPETIGRARAVSRYIGDGASADGYGNNGYIGLNNAIITTGSYAGVNVATETALQGQVNTGGVHASFSTDPFPSLVESTIDGMRGTDRGMGDYTPQYGFIDPTGFAYLLNAANDQRRSVNHEKDTKLGVEALTFMGVKWIMDRFCPTLTYYIVNTKYIEEHTPYGALNQVKKRDVSAESGEPLATNLLCFNYSKFIVTLPRAQVRVTYA